MSHKATRAIIMAAGIGQRLKPITEHTPKPLIKVNGIPIVETMIEGLIANGICEIYIVVGHLKWQFEYLCRKYSVCLLENPHYLTSNNISSLYVAREFLGNSIVCDGDQILANPQVLQPAFEASGYCSSWTQETDEWLQTIDSKGFVQACSRTGGTNGWQLYSISFWTMDDGMRMKRHLEELIETHAGFYWDDIPMFLRKDEYRLKIRPITPSDVIEIDTIQDLEAVNTK